MLTNRVGLIENKTELALQTAKDNFIKAKGIVETYEAYDELILESKEKIQSAEEILSEIDDQLKNARLEVSEAETRLEGVKTLLESQSTDIQRLSKDFQDIAPVKLNFY